MAEQPKTLKEAVDQLKNATAQYQIFDALGDKEAKENVKKLIEELIKLNTNMARNAMQTAKTPAAADYEQGITQGANSALAEAKNSQRVIDGADKAARHWSIWTPNRTINAIVNRGQIPYGASPGEAMQGAYQAGTGTAGAVGAGIGSMLAKGGGPWGMAIGATVGMAWDAMKAIVGPRIEQIPERIQLGARTGWGAESVTHQMRLGANRGFSPDETLKLMNQLSGLGPGAVETTSLIQTFARNKGMDPSAVAGLVHPIRAQGATGASMDHQLKQTLTDAVSSGFENTDMPRFMSEMVRLMSTMVGGLGSPLAVSGAMSALSQQNGYFSSPERVSTATAAYMGFGSAGIMGHPFEIKMAHDVLTSSGINPTGIQLHKMMQVMTRYAGGDTSDLPPDLASLVEQLGGGASVMRKMGQSAERTSPEYGFAAETTGFGLFGNSVQTDITMRGYRAATEKSVEDDYRERNKPIDPELRESLDFSLKRSYERLRATQIVIGEEGLKQVAGFAEMATEALAVKEGVDESEVGRYYKKKNMEEDSKIKEAAQQPKGFWGHAADVALKAQTGFGSYMPMDVLRRWLTKGGLGNPISDLISDGDSGGPSSGDIGGPGRGGVGASSSGPAPGFRTRGAPRKGWRTDRHNNPTAMTVDVARQGGLVEGVDFEVGDPFAGGYTARLLGDAYEKTKRVIDKIGFYTKSGRPRWKHTHMSKEEWNRGGEEGKDSTIGKMYRHEGGSGALARPTTSSTNPYYDEKAGLSRNVNPDELEAWRQLSNFESTIRQLSSGTSSNLYNK